MHYEAKKFHDDRMVFRVGKNDSFGPTQHVPIRYKNAKGDTQYGWFPLDLWQQLPDVPSELPKETP